METTILKVLRDCKLTDGTQLRLASIQATSMIELSTVRGVDDIMSKIHLPDTIETALELMSMGDKLLRKSLEKDLGKVVVAKPITQDTLDSISKQMENNGYVIGETYGFMLGIDWKGSGITTNSNPSSIWWKDENGSHTTPLYDLPSIPCNMLYNPSN